MQVACSAPKASNLPDLQRRAHAPDEGGDSIKGLQLQLQPREGAHLGNWDTFGATWFVASHLRQLARELTITSLELSITSQPTLGPPRLLFDSPCPWSSSNVAPAGAGSTPERPAGSLRPAPNRPKPDGQATLCDDGPARPTAGEATMPCLFFFSIAVSVSVTHASVWLEPTRAHSPRCRNSPLA